jgi:biopolymer transport protein ExbD
MAETLSSGGRGRRGGGGIVGINVTPMVDVVLVLLVIMMVSATYVVAKSLKVDLPKSQTSDGSAATTAVVSIQENGDYHWNDAKVNEEELVANLKRASTESRETTVVVSADAKTDHGAVVHVMDLARRESITRFAVQVAQKR